MFQEQDTTELFRRITPVKAELLRELAGGWTEREASDRLGIAYNTVRAQVNDLKQIAGVRSVRELARWWRGYRAAWLMFMAQASGVGPEEIVEVREKRTIRI